ncbi:unnamed protein product [Spodoptera exigua]|nr:unnamed protein product [Spodoptera exigua]
MKTDLPYGIIASSKTRVRCLVCGVHIPKANKCIEQHTNGAKHKENIELMNENAISFSNGKINCNLCKRILPEEESVTHHIESDDHANFMAALEDLVDGEFISLDPYLACEKDEVHCEVCNKNIYCSLKTIQEHVNDLYHRFQITERLKPLNGLFPAANNTEVWCKVCKIYIQDNVLSVLDHIDEDEEHIEWFSEIEDLIDNQDVSIEHYLTNEHEECAFCNRCQMDIVCNAQSIQSHVHSEAHLNQFGL